MGWKVTKPQSRSNHCSKRSEDLKVAGAFSASGNSLLFKIVTKNFMERGVDISFLSCFPGEKEHLFPPLTYLCPTGNTQSVTLADGKEVEVVEVEPTFGT